ncbi:ATP-binding protein [Streptomyces vinaceus]|uniref:ATP-binding protein n=1 Tax=Streptomyces vinaceus TaxID=1960 RepID=UPI0037F37E7E
MELQTADNVQDFRAIYTWRGEREPGPDVLTAAERLLDVCSYDRADGHHRLTVGQRTPATGTPAQQRIEQAHRELREAGGLSVDDELRTQNRQLLAALEESRAQQEELQRLNAELEETNQGVVALYSELSQELEETNTGVVALYAELEEKTRQLHQASEAKTRFWANVSHELRSPVNAVISLARLLLAPGADALTEEQHQQVSLISASGSTLLALVEELLDVAKAESGRLEPQRTVTDLRSLLHQLRGTLQGMVHEEVVLDVADVEGTPQLFTDEVMLTRILRNLLSNGLKFTTVGHVRLTTTAEQRSEGQWYVFTATDTGVGIPPDEQGRIFEEFYQVRGPHQRHQPGTGLGLPYARRLTDLLGGRLTLTSEPGEGTTVRVEIPAHGTGAGTPPVRVPQDDLPGDEAPPAVRHLVVVDDDPAFLASLRPELRRLAGTTTEVTVSAEALETVRAQRPDALLIDLAMPHPDGYSLLALLAEDEATAHIPVVVLTASDPAGLDHTRLGHARRVLDKTHLTATRLAAALAAAPPGPHPPTGTRR